MKRFESNEGFFLLDTVISLLVISVIVIEILAFALNARGAAVKTNAKIVESIEVRNRRAIELFEIQK